ncbi:MAG: hypothetical protein R6U70_04325 [Bacillota bacterium]
MHLLQRLGFDRGDERSVSIALHSCRTAWMFTTAVLMVWSLHSVICTGRLSIEFVVFAASQATFWTSHLYYTRKMGG